MGKAIKKKSHKAKKLEASFLIKESIPRSTGKLSFDVRGTEVVLDLSNTVRVKYESIDNEIFYLSGNDKSGSN